MGIFVAGKKINRNIPIAIGCKFVIRKFVGLCIMNENNETIEQ